MFNRTYHVRARRERLQGEQLDISFPRRGRPSKFRRLEKCGQMRLNLQPGKSAENVPTEPIVQKEPESFERALELTFPERPLTEMELAAEFERLFPIAP